MAVEMRGRYTGNLKVEIVHGPSGAEQSTAAPVDNKGDGSSFSPTDLVAAALGTCAITTMAIVAEREGIPFEQASFRLEKHMGGPPRRISRIPVQILLPESLDAAQRRVLENTARNCPVALTLNDEVEKSFEFVYGDVEGMSSLPHTSCPRE